MSIKTSDHFNPVLFFPFFLNWLVCHTDLKKKKKKRRSLLLKVLFIQSLSLDLT